MTTLKLDAWLFDVRAGWQAGPLLVEVAGIYSTGNRAKDRIDENQSRIKYFQPIDTDSGFYGAWGELRALNIDFVTSQRLSQGNVFSGVGIGYDKYGLVRFGSRASYALTPSFTLRG